jgi:hypothetical protein
MSTSWAVGRLRLFLVACLLISPSGCMTAGLWETALDRRAGVGRTEELTLVGFSLDARGCLVMRAENRDGLEQQFILGAGPEDEHARALVWSGAARDCSIRLDLWATEGASGTGTLELGGELVRPVRVLQAALASPVGEPAVLPLLKQL